MVSGEEAGRAINGCMAVAAMAVVTALLLAGMVGYVVGTYECPVPKPPPRVYMEPPALIKL